MSMEAGAASILIVEDHALTRRFLADNLAADGYEPAEAGCVADARRALSADAPDLMIIDLGLPDRDGLELVGEVRQAGRIVGSIDAALPVLILSGRAGELDRLRGFARGADDYLVKPFSYAELRARIDALLRRAHGRPRSGPLRVGTLQIDPASRGVWVDGRAVTLSKKEYALLRCLASEPTRVFTRDELLREVWGFPEVVPTRTLDSHASRLRVKLSTPQQAFIVNVWGVGYRLTDAGPAS
jgi:DNA-binding response OmpR family regulator